ncbi:FtsW/RodA/SpoVE family cell cycle protein [Chakrabartyella piscis]|uniref:FtsW/RodA/SpoVE family cell cycle protein n=1 Tax=Chakrabartyella piscis TaxID=2918914 RepID=UPI00295879C6|nr:FtsW/RodA/SpoVE family cell cycle protein [Chakrabartyella piscis]
MFDLLIVLSRYVFVFYIILFLWQGVVYVAYEQGGYFGNPFRAISVQKRILVCYHLTAFLILGYNRETLMYQWQVVAFGFAGLVFLLVAMYVLNRFYKDGCPLIWMGVLFLLDTSLIMLQRLNASLAYRQLAFIVFGVFVVLCIPRILKLIPKFEIFEWAYIIVSYGLLICTLLFGVSHYGSTNWLKIGSITFQPSEIVKFLYIFYLASVFRKKVDWKEFLTTGFLSFGLIILLVFQKDLGSALIFFVTYLSLLYIATSNLVLMGVGLGSASIAAIASYHLFSHVQVRVSAWQNPWSDIEGGGYQIANSLFAITTFGFFGCGLTKGYPTVIPVVESDFIFAAIAEEFGVIFACGIIGIFVMLLYRGVRIALDCGRRYYSILALGITAILSFQTFLIIGGVIKLIPLTGVTLPFISYGGSSVLVSLIMIGLLQWVCIYCKKHGDGTQGKEKKTPSAKKTASTKEKVEVNEVSGGEAYE